jgi:DNA-binding NtrC family response regulator
MISTEVNLSSARPALSSSHPSPQPGQATVLICDDEELIRWSLAEHLSQQGYRVVEAADGVEGLEKVRAEAPDLILTDLKMPRMDGLELLRRLREQESDIPVLVITAYGAVDSAIEATRLGARAYLSKPFDLREVTLQVHKTLDGHRLETEVRYLRSLKAESYGPIIGRSAALSKLVHTLRRLESIDAPTVLITGPSGTGKELIAHAIHDMGRRRAGPMMEVDCASLTETLIESELFGHEKGAFTDARAMRRGRFESAKGGTIFLDEIGEMSLSTQARLLRALESRRFKRVGGVADIQMDASIIAATNRDLAEEVRQGRFREDLYFRLNVVRVDVPALRERREDIPLLVDHFLQRFNKEFHREVRGITEEALALLVSWPWPGNVRELRNVIERVLILEADDLIRAEHLPSELRYGRGHAPLSGPGADPFVLPEGGCNLEEVERGLIAQAMERCKGNQSAAARLLGLTRYALRYRLEKHALPGRPGEA